VASKNNKNKKSGQAARAQQQADAARRRGGGQVGRGGATPAAQPESAGEAPKASQSPKASGAQRRYLDVSAVRIQEWLGRTPDLKFRRGASGLLTEVTEQRAWQAGRLPEGARWNVEAGEVDGVVSLELDAGADTQRVADIAREVAGVLRKELPYCPVQAVTGTGASYVQAYEQMVDARKAGQLLVDSSAAPPEVILAKPCDQCRSAAATEPGVWEVDGVKRDLCRDCLARFNAAGGTAGTRRREPRPERVLREALEKVGTHVIGFPDNSQQLAKAGRIDDDKTPTQIALIYADGNGVGAFIREAAQHRVPKQEIVPAIDRATVGALADAVLGRFTGWSRPPVLANLFGGDDVLVSVPAADAWQFTRALLAAFGERIAEAASGWHPQVRERCPSLSAGLIFHDAKDPFSDMVRLADEQLKAAKKATRGKAASVAFLDVTADGETAPKSREPLRLAELDGLADRLGRIEREIRASRRAALLNWLRQGETERFIWRLTELENPALWEVVMADETSGQAIRDELRQNPKAINELRRVLDLARHWHTGPRTEVQV
jgi:hypothetical protein